MIRIIDYGLGNIRAFLNVYKRLNLEADRATTAADIATATKLVLPGVGAFDHAMTLLDASGMREALEEAALARRIPVLGICVGMQILASGSDEGRLRGLGWVPGRVRSFQAFQMPDLRLPHMGWNDVKPSTDSSLFLDIAAGTTFYFLHSFYFECSDPVHSSATAVYGQEFSCAVRRDNIYGVQFHPEKSHRSGQTILKNFALSC